MFRVIRSGKRKSKYLQLPNFVFCWLAYIYKFLISAAYACPLLYYLLPLGSLRVISLTILIRLIFAAKQWKRMVTKATFVGAGFTRKPPKYERFIRPSGLRFTKAHVTHPELKCTFNLEIIGVKKNPNGPMYTSLGVITKGTIIEVIFLFQQCILKFI